MQAVLEVRQGLSDVTWAVAAAGLTVELTVGTHNPTFVTDVIDGGGGRRRLLLSFFCVTHTRRLAVFVLVEDSVTLCLL